MKISLALIKKVVSAHYGVEVHDIEGPWRKAKIVRARHVTMYFARRLTKMAFSAIGRDMGDKDHTTVLMAVKRIEELIEEYPATASKLAVILKKIYAEAEKRQKGDNHAE